MDPCFKVHMLNERGIQRAKVLADNFDRLLDSLKIIIEPDGSEPVSREFSLAKTHLELASFYSKKAMANNPNNQKVDA